MPEVPDASRPSSEAAERIVRAFASLRERNIGFLVEEELSGVHSPERAQAVATQPIHLSQELRQEDRRTLDDAVFELLGESDRARRKALVNRLYEETARHFRQIRVVEIQKMEQRAKTAARRFTAEELAADAWDAIYLKDSPSIVQLLSSQSGPKVLVAVPAEGAPRLVDENSMFDREVVFFGAGRKAGRVVCASRAQAELLGRLATLGIRGDVAVPESENLCHELRATIDAQLETARNQIVSIPATLRQPVKTLQRFRCTRNYERHTAVPAANDSFSLGLTACLACSNTAAKAGDSLVSIGAHDGCRTKVQL